MVGSSLASREWIYPDVYSCYTRIQSYYSTALARSCSQQVYREVESRYTLPAGRAAGILISRGIARRAYPVQRADGRNGGAMLRSVCADGGRVLVGHRPRRMRPRVPSVPVAHHLLDAGPLALPMQPGTWILLG